MGEEMQNEKEKSEMYNQTISGSRAESLQRAIEIFMESMEKQEAAIKRPNINPLKGVLKILAVLLVTALACTVLALFEKPIWYGLLFLLFAAFLNAKKTAIWLVLIYQKYAPAHIRAACSYTPTCSEYMILSIKKYGFLKGVFKGLNRLLRCRYPNGGIDNP